MDAAAGLSAGDALSWWIAVMGAGGGASVLTALISWRRARAEAATSAPVGPPMLPPEARAAIGCGLADRLSIERIERIEDLVVEQGRAMERMFGLLGRQHAEIGDQIRRLGDRVDRGIDEGRDGRRAIEDGLRDVRDQVGRG